MYFKDSNSILTYLNSKISFQKREQAIIDSIDDNITIFRHLSLKNLVLACDKDFKEFRETYSALDSKSTYYQHKENLIELTTNYILSKYSRYISRESDFIINFPKLDIDDEFEVLYSIFYKNCLIILGQIDNDMVANFKILFRPPIKNKLNELIINEYT